MSIITQRLNQDLTKVILHHTESASDILGLELNTQAIRDQQFGLPYDIIINTTGTVDLTARWTYAPNPALYVQSVAPVRIMKYTTHHVSAAGDTDDINKTALHIALAGNFSTQAPTAQQLSSLLLVLLAIKRVIPGITILFHSDISTTACPGSKFFSRYIVGATGRLVDRYRRTEFVLLRPGRTVETYNTQLGLGVPTELVIISPQEWEKFYTSDGDEFWTSDDEPIYVPR